jgi:hypothetical protein
MVVGSDCPFRDPSYYFFDQGLIFALSVVDSHWSMIDNGFGSAPRRDHKQSECSFGANCGLKTTFSLDDAKKKKKKLVHQDLCDQCDAVADVDTMQIVESSHYLLGSDLVKVT